ncbi:trypsin-1-like [Bacillus rossius redtenbacheri]|uniref:trypsin-1-like n=1 Tax=Bacillus rossius redtenbacheri TaxID=93214 RepID=UPI002FDD8A7A
MLRVKVDIEVVFKDCNLYITWGYTNTANRVITGASKMLSTIILLGLLSFIRAGEATREVSPRISSGSEAQIQQYPYLVSLDQALGGSELHYCTGAVIGDLWVLTSARCTTSEQASSLVVRAGGGSPGQGARHEAALVLTHPSYTSVDEPQNDIGLIKVKTPFSYSASLQAAKLPSANSSLAAGAVSTVVGWGRQGSGGQALVPRAVTASLVSNQECSRDFQQGLITDGNICADSLRASGKVAEADSGSPVVVAGTLVGVVSWTSDYIAYYNIYANVSTYRSWIYSQTGV